jgi:hypothetical protein
MRGTTPPAEVTGDGAVALGPDPGVLISPMRSAAPRPVVHRAVVGKPSAADLDVQHATAATGVVAHRGVTRTDVMAGWTSPWLFWRERDPRSVWPFGPKASRVAGPPDRWARDGREGEVP